MVDESRVEIASAGITGSCATPSPDSQFRNLNWIACIKHPDFGVVTVRLDASVMLDISRPNQKWETYLGAIIDGGIAGIAEAARTA